MKTGPLVSVIIPTYNRAYILEEAVDSVLRQTYPKVETIVVDDGSTDNTQEVLKRYKDSVRVVTQSNAGPAAARNHGLAVCRGDLVAFLDSDDLWLPTKLERQVRLLARAGQSAPCCLCNILMRWRHKTAATSFETAWLVPSLPEGIWYDVEEVLVTRFVLFNQGVMIRREVLCQLGGFDARLPYMEDYALSLRLSVQGPWAYIRQPLAIWRETHDSPYRRSQTEINRVRGCIIQNLYAELLSSSEGKRQERLRRCLDSELNRVRRTARAAEANRMSFWGASAVGRSLLAVERLRTGLFRRSPMFSAMKVGAFSDEPR